MLKIKAAAIASTLIAGATVSGLASADLFPTPLPNTGFVQYQDFNSYSLPILNYFATGTTTQNPGDPFYIPSSPGQIQDLIVVYTGAGGTGVTTNLSTEPFVTADNAESACSGSTCNTFDNGTDGIDPNPTFTGDNTDPLGQVWDIQIGDLKTFLNGGQLVFLFNNNQTNSGTAADQTLSIMAAVSIGNQTFFFEQTGGNTNFFDGDNYVVSGGQVCLNGTTFAIEPCGATPGQIGPFNHNLGANQVAYAIVGRDAFNTALANASDTDIMSIRVLMGCGEIDPNVTTTQSCFPLNNGYEQLFIASTTSNIPLPEPGTLVLVGLGMLGLVWTLRRRHG